MQKYYAAKESPNGEYVTTNHIRHSVESVDPARAHIPAGRENDMTLYDTLEDFLSTEGLERADDHTFPILPATDEMKAAKIAELSEAARLESESDITVDGVGLFHVDAKTILQLTTIEALIADGTHPALVGGEYPNYKCVDGSFVNLSATDMATIRTASNGS